MQSYSLNWKKIDKEELKDFLFNNNVKIFDEKRLYDAVDNLYKEGIDPQNDIVLELTENIKTLIVNSPTFSDLDEDVFSVMMSNLSYNDVISLCRAKKIHLCEDVSFWELYLIKRHNMYV